MSLSMGTLCKRSRLWVVVTALVACAAIAPARATARVPQGFVGVVAGGPFFDPAVASGHQMDLMVTGGVESLRVVFNWAGAQPYKSFSDVPAGQLGQFSDVNGVPTSFRDLDLIVGLAAAHGIRILPVVQYAPYWDARDPSNGYSAPASPTPYANFLTALIHRYGPSGTFWSANPSIPRLPIGMWQIWNEPNFSGYWNVQPNFYPSYLQLLRAAHTAIKAADPRAKVVFAGLTNFSWRYLARFYRLGARGTFDVAAIHPYTGSAGGVIKIAQLVRAVMNGAGDRHKPILVTEFAWPASRGKTKLQYEFDTNEVGQATRLARMLPMLASQRVKLGLAGFYYYTWISNYDPAANYPFDYTGLLKYRSGQVSTTPAYGIFRHDALAMEGCRSKASVATRCAG
jgi:arabinogalactan endo-1,4-beta-galactosidase